MAAFVARTWAAACPGAAATLSTPPATMLAARSEAAGGANARVRVAGISEPLP